MVMFKFNLSKSNPTENKRTKTIQSSFFINQIILVITIKTNKVGIYHR